MCWPEERSLPSLPLLPSAAVPVPSSTISHASVLVSYFYSIVSEVNISGTDYLYISGRFEDWGTILSGGTSVGYELIQYV